MRNRLRLVAVALLTMAGILVAAAPASAAVPGLSYVTAFSVTDSTVYKSITADCPAGLRVIGLGFWLEGAPGAVVLDDFIPNATSVTVGAGEIVGPGEPSDGTTQSWRVGATAVCAVAPPGLEIVTDVTGTESGGVPYAEATATCPSGKSLLGAGANLNQGFGQISINTLAITSGSVRGVAVPDEDGFSGTWSMKVYAICATPIPGLHIFSAFADFFGASATSIKAACPEGTRAIGSGWDLNGVRDELAIDVYIADGTGVSLYFANEDANGFNGIWRASVRAVCASV
jgi:hypothetical protein